MSTWVNATSIPPLPKYCFISLIINIYFYEKKRIHYISPQAIGIDEAKQQNWKASIATRN